MVGSAGWRGASSMSWDQKRNHGACLAGLAQSDLPSSLLPFPCHPSPSAHNCQFFSLSPKVIPGASRDMVTICWETWLFGAAVPSLQGLHKLLLSRVRLRGISDQMLFSQLNKNSFILTPGPPNICASFRLEKDLLQPAFPGSLGEL